MSIRDLQEKQPLRIKRIGVLLVHVRVQANLFQEKVDGTTKMNLDRKANKPEVPAIAKSNDSTRLVQVSRPRRSENKTAQGIAASLSENGEICDPTLSVEKSPHPESVPGRWYPSYTQSNDGASLLTTFSTRTWRPAGLDALEAWRVSSATLSAEPAAMPPLDASPVDEPLHDDASNVELEGDDAGGYRALQRSDTLINCLSPEWKVEFCSVEEFDRRLLLYGC